jgi:Leucine-rich repeat (LRR) protein
LLHSIETLEKINGKPSLEFWKEVDAQQAAFDTWRTHVAGLPAAKQGEAVAVKLKELNPAFDGKLSAPAKIEKGVVTGIEFVTDQVTDVSPVLALTGLRSLNCGGTASKGRLADLSPLKGTSLTILTCSGTQVADLSPLKDMKLTELYCSDTKVTDLAPLTGMSLEKLFCHNTKVSDLSPLTGMPLTILTSGHTQVSDLSPLKGMPLMGATFEHTQVSDLSPLEGMALQGVLFTPKNITRRMEVLRQMTTLKAIGVGMGAKEHWPAADFWKKYDAGEFK